MRRFQDMTPELEDLVVDLHRCEAVTFNKNYVPETGDVPYKVDLHRLTEKPCLIKNLAVALWEVGGYYHLISHICCARLGILPLATILATEKNKMLITKNKSGNKDYIEGYFEEGDRCVIVEDIIASGNRAIKLADILRESGMIVEAVFTLIDMEHDIKDKLNQAALKSYSLFTITDIANCLMRRGRIKPAICEYVKAYINTQRLAIVDEISNVPSTCDASRRRESNLENDIEKLRLQFSKVTISVATVYEPMEVEVY